jgi:methylmalonyl-CoA/ethylmalonyl-CoA epimerase
MLNGIDHVGIAVEDLDAAVELYGRTLGLEPAHRAVVETQGVEEVLFEVGHSRIQLVGALGPDTPVGRFLAKHGPGLHHLGLGVDDVAVTLQTLRAAGIPLVDESPRSGPRGTSIAFVHPAGMGGVLIELVQYPR